MKKIRLGRTELMVGASSFGALPIQRLSKPEAVKLLREAYELGMNYFDTAHGYTDSEEKIGMALSDVRKDIIISTKSPAKDKKTLLEDIETSLERMKTDYIDLLQLHNPDTLPDSEDPDGLYGGLLEAKRQGMIRHIGITNHRQHIAKQAVESGLYETLQFPFSYLASEKDEALVKRCAEKNVGFICMKALSGGLITRSDAAYAYLAQFPNTLPIWGIQRESELDEFLAYNDNPPQMTDALAAFIEQERVSLAGDFCRGCGYCMPCPAGIEINQCARMSLLLRRSPAANWLTPAWQEKMEKIEDCLHCGQCMKRCPYGLQTPDLLRRNLEDYRTFLH